MHASRPEFGWKTTRDEVIPAIEAPRSKLRGIFDPLEEQLPSFLLAGGFTSAPVPPTREAVLSPSGNLPDSSGKVPGGDRSCSGRSLPGRPAPGLGKGGSEEGYACLPQAVQEAFSIGTTSLPL